MSQLGWMLALVSLVLNPKLSAAANLAAAADLPPGLLDTNDVPDVTRAFLRLQEQLHAAQLAIERNRQDAEAAAVRNTEAVSARLQTLEASLTAQRAREFETQQATYRLILTLGGACAVIGFLAMLLTAYLQWRAVSRLTEFSVLTQAALTSGRGALPPPGASDAPSVSTALTDQANARLFGALDRLEQRILELEHTAHLPDAGKNSALAAPVSDPTADRAGRVAVLLAKAESLLSMEKVEDALACYDEILGLEPGHSDVLVKKGDVLERLHRIDDAINCYDRAIAADGSLTVAYLHKGGLFNRLERYEEALQCYEQALRTQEKAHAE